MITVTENGHPLTYTFDDLMKYHGPGFPGGVAHAYQALQRALLELDDGTGIERREITINTPFAGPGARDAFEMVTRAVTGDRYHVRPELALPERGYLLERYVFTVAYRERETTVILRDAGFVVPEFIDLARKQGRTEAEESRLTVLKQEMADRLLARPATEVYDVAQ
ncbi:hypothetical protein HT102_01425 [Hoyosella sp. G463]|uniref:Uncharacterized protein n=1 Tax=Lolliginicoccus lacisalsi TaxID=2742202 RepID=A0A927J9H1_9ACTN|nr:hypothetical protein [Lolliginicoccus lacisalsi]MBD8505151.1 hypothetical protein [Lolliginicoccus lacisalsi]